MGTVGIYIHYILYSFVLLLYLKCGVVWGGGGCNVFLTFYAISNISRKKSGNSFLYPLFLCSDFVSQMWGGLGGGGVMFFSHFMLFPTFLEKNLGIQI